jgi:hypothetical protein
MGSTTLWSSSAPLPSPRASRHLQTSQGPRARRTHLPRARCASPPLGPAPLAGATRWLQGIAAAGKPTTAGSMPCSKISSPTKKNVPTLSRNCCSAGRSGPADGRWWSATSPPESASTTATSGAISLPPRTSVVSSKRQTTAASATNRSETHFALFCSERRNRPNESLLPATPA